MSSLICGNCDWYKHCFCNNKDSVFCNTKVNSYDTCGHFFPSLSTIAKEKIKEKETVNHQITTT